MTRLRLRWLLLPALVFAVLGAGAPFAALVRAGEEVPGPTAPARAGSKKAAAKGETPAPAKASASAPTKRVPLLWEVDTKPRIYLFGTIHIADPRVLDHPPVVKKALADSQALYTEIAMDQADMLAIQKLMFLPEGESLQKILPKDVYAKTEKLFGAKGIPLKMLDRIKPWGIWLQMQALDAPKPKAGQAALDVMLFQGAQAAEKTVGGLELPSEQIDIFDKLERDQQIRLLRDAVEAAATAKEKGVSPLAGLTEVYLSGDAEKLFNVLFSSFDQNDPFSRMLLTKLIDDRNVRMVRRMLEKGQKHPEKTMFVAVGAGHFPGKHGILNLLNRTGFRTRRLTSLADMEKPWPPVAKKEAPVRSPRRSRRRYIRVGPFRIPAGCCPQPCNPQPCCPPAR